MTAQAVTVTVTVGVRLGAPCRSDSGRHGAQRHPAVTVAGSLPLSEPEAARAPGRVRRTVAAAVAAAWPPLHPHTTRAMLSPSQAQPMVNTY